MKKKRVLIATLLMTISVSTFGQENLTRRLMFEGYLEAYYSYDFANPSNHERPDFFYAFDRHNEFNLNIAFLQATYESARVKANLALMTGTYAKANLAHEPATYRIIQEANISVKPFKNRKDWLTVGVFPSHIGFESAVGADCFNLTRSLAAENSPYYLAGLKYETKSDNEKWEFGLTLTNGWQRIQRLDGNQLISGGHQLSYLPSDKIKFNSSSFIGTDFPDSTRKMRYFHDFYTEFDASDRISFILGFDVGWQQKVKHGKEHSVWYTPAVLTRFRLNEKFSLATRIEYYHDPDEVIIATFDNNGFSTLGFSLNLDYHFTGNVLFRLEGRTLQNDRAIYLNANDQLSRGNTFVTTSLSLRF